VSQLLENWRLNKIIEKKIIVFENFVNIDNYRSIDMILNFLETKLFADKIKNK
jgi:hypothetical protein